MGIKASTGAAGPLAGRSEALLAALMLAGVAASLISARLTPFALYAPLLVAGLAAMTRGKWRDLVPEWGGVTMAMAALLAFALMSTLWAEAGGKAIGKLLSVAATAGAALILAQYFRSAEAKIATAAANGMRTGFAVGLAFLLIELLTGQSIQIAVYNLLDLPHHMMQPERHFTWAGDTLTAIELAHINRNLAVAALLAFPAALAAHATLGPPWNKISSVAFVVLATVAALLSRHESSMISLVAGMAIFALGCMSRPWTARLLGAAWVIACLAVLPIALLAGRGHLDKVPWLHHSLQHRFVIWNYTAEETLKAPVLGIGAYMTYVIGPERNKTAVKAPGELYKKTLSRHAHNVYLQTWYELGAVGAALLMAFGLTLLAAIRRMSEYVQPFALATFATAATMISSSYGMWQTWYLALFAFAAVALTAAARASSNPQDSGASGLAEP